MEEIREKLPEEKKNVLKTGCVIAVSALLGYKAGVRITDAKFSNGIKRLWEVDPELKDRMYDALVKVWKCKK